ncbi:MAG: DUF1761 domain-containing protein [Bacteroidota bacterium]
MEINFYAVLVAALSSFVVGFIWYNPKVFGTIWMREAGMSQEQAEKGNMAKIFGLTFIYSLMIAFMMQMIVIHQFGALGMVGGDPTLAKPSFAAFMTDYGMAFRTFKHGALHGFMAALFIATPIICIDGLFEQKSWKYMLVKVGYWMTIMTVMGAIVCGWV